MSSPRLYRDLTPGMTTTAGKQVDRIKITLGAVLITWTDGGTSHHRGDQTAWVKG